MAVKKTELYSLLWEAANKLRGGVEPARYKDYVLTLLFFKYVSDRYKGQRFGDFTVKEGASFDDLSKAKGKKDVGERVDKILSAFLEDNALQGSLPEVSFNNEDELGRGQELVDKVSGLIAIFENPAIDFKSNRASGDDIVGDAYEYFMMKFAQESGKSKGQFYTPSEVSRTMARLLGISHIRQEKGKSWTLYDPACGSGSLLIRAADEAPTNEYGDSIVTIFGQEKDKSTAGLAKMNLVLHQKGTGEILTNSTLSSPQFLDRYEQLRKFDFIVMNPPFSDKSWADGITPERDKYHRFDGYDIPPEKNGDWAWFLHVLKSLDDNGKAAIIMPRGILFRGNSEAMVRKQVLERKYIAGIVSLPGNLFYGTGIPACIVVIDKELAEERESLFMIDASRGFKKDGAKNRLREQDIEKIVRTFTSHIEIEGYSREVSYQEILELNDGNLNVPRYIQRISDELPQNIEAHLQGGIPQLDIDSLQALWDVAPDLKTTLFRKLDNGRYALLHEPDELATLIMNNPALKDEETLETETVLRRWEDQARTPLLSVTKDTEPRMFIREIASNLLEGFTQAKILDNYDVFDVLMNYWNEKLQDDVYIIKSGGYGAGREIEYVYGTKKSKEAGQTFMVEDKSKIKGFDGVLIPAVLIEEAFFPEEQSALQQLSEQVEGIESELETLIEDQPEEGNLFAEVINSSGNITDKNLKTRLAILESKKHSEQLDRMSELAEAVNEKNEKQIKALLKKYPDISTLDIYGKTSKPIKSKVTAALKVLSADAPIPEQYQDEYAALIEYASKSEAVKRLTKEYKKQRSALDELVKDRYAELSVEEIKGFLFDSKWMAYIQQTIRAEFEQKANYYALRITEIAKRYEHTLPDIEARVQASREAVIASLEKMGYTW